MNNNDLRNIARRLEGANRNNKLKVQHKRTKFAATKAKIEQLPTPTKFIKYKYG